MPVPSQDLEFSTSYIVIVVVFNCLIFVELLSIIVKLSFHRKRIRLSVYRKEHKHAKIVCLFFVNGMLSVNSLIVAA